MRKHDVTIAAALLALGLSGSANATTMSAAGGLRAAIADTSIVEAVHCVPGWVHWHRWGWGTGCVYRPYRYYYAPRVYFGPRVYRRWWW